MELKFLCVRLNSCFCSGCQPLTTVIAVTVFRGCVTQLDASDLFLLPSFGLADYQSFNPLCRGWVHGSNFQIMSTLSERIFGVGGLSVSQMLPGPADFFHNL